MDQESNGSGMFTSLVEKDARSLAFIEKAKAKHGDKYDYTNSVWSGLKEPITVTCPTHGDWITKPVNHIYSGNGCPECGKVIAAQSRKISREDFIKACQEKHGDRYDYSEVAYTGNHDKTIFICRTHGRFEQACSGHRSGQGCPKCAIEEAGNRYRGNTEDFIEKARKVHGDIHDYSRTVYGRNTEEKVLIGCKNGHGFFLQSPHMHLHGHGCLQCHNDTAGHHRRHTTEDFIRKARAKHGDRFDYSPVAYINDRTPVRVLCKVPGHGEFMTKPNSHLSLKAGCPKCISSDGENEIRRILESLNLEFEEQYRLPNTGTLYRFDFYIPSKDLLIEFQGMQHFKPMGYTAKPGAFEDTLRRDRLKKDLALTLKYSLVFFDYMQFDKLNDAEFSQLVIDTVNRYKDITHDQKGALNGK